MSAMRGKTVVITGATSGIGAVAAMALAGQGARIVFVARDRARADAALAKLKAVGAADHVAHIADLSRLSEMKRVGALLAAEPQIDVLINNAGALFGTRRETADGLEMTFAVNHMAYFVLTNLILPTLKPGARIVSTASNAHRGGKLNFGDLQSRCGYRSYSAYARSKLCNILFTRELARRIAGRGITANCLHPGFVASRFGDESGGVTGRVIVFAKSLVAISPEKGAKTIIYLAASPEVADISGEYFYKCKIAQPTRAAMSDTDAKRLWDVSARISGVG